MDLLWKTIIIYFLIMLVLRFMGKREIGQLSIFDFAVLLLVADISALALDTSQNYWLCLLPVILLALIQKVLAYLSLKVNFLRSLFDGKQSVIIYKGKLNIKEMRKQRYNIDDLLTQLRLKNIKSLSQVEYLILENNGEISVFLKNGEYSENTSIKSKSFNVNSTGSSSVTQISKYRNISVFPVVVSGKIVKENVKLLGLTEDKVISDSQDIGYEIKDIYFANYEEGKLFIMECN